MSCNTVRTKDGGVTVTIDRPEVWLNVAIGKDGKIIEMSHELRPARGECRFHGDTMKTLKTRTCCENVVRPLTFLCRRENLDIEMPVAQCLMCEYHEEVDNG